jgi:hypothetical protein
MSLLYAAAVDKNEALYQSAFRTGRRPHGALADAMHGRCPETMNFLLSRLELWEMPFLKQVTTRYAKHDRYAKMVGMMNAWYEDQVNRLSKQAQYYYTASVP